MSLLVLLVCLVSSPSTVATTIEADAFGPSRFFPDRTWVYVGQAYTAERLAATPYGQMLQGREWNETLRTYFVAVSMAIPEAAGFLIPIYRELSTEYARIEKLRTLPAGLGLFPVPENEDLIGMGLALVVEAGAEADELDALFTRWMESAGAASTTVNSTEFLVLSIPAMESVLHYGRSEGALVFALGSRTPHVVLEALADRSASLAPNHHVARARRRLAPESPLDSVIFINIRSILDFTERYLSSAGMQISPDLAGLAGRAFPALSIGSTARDAEMEIAAFLEMNREILPRADVGEFPLSALERVPEGTLFALGGRFDPLAVARSIAEAGLAIDLGVVPKWTEQRPWWRRRDGVEREPVQGHSIAQLLGQSGFTAVIYEEPSLRGALPQLVVLVTADDPEAFDRTMRVWEYRLYHFLDLGGLHPQRRESTADDITVRSVPFAASGVRTAPGWARHGDQFVIGLFPYVVREAIDRLERGSSSLAEQPGFQEARAHHPASILGLSFIDTPAIARFVISSLAPTLHSGIAFAKSWSIPIPIEAADLTALSRLTRPLTPELATLESHDEGITFRSRGSVPIFTASAVGTTLFFLSAPFLAGEANQIGRAAYLWYEHKTSWKLLRAACLEFREKTGGWPRSFFDLRDHKRLQNELFSFVFFRDPDSDIVFAGLPVAWLTTVPVMRRDGTVRFESARTIREMLSR